MKLRIANLRAGLTENKEQIIKKAAKRLGLRMTQIAHLEITKEAIDARKKQELRLVYTVEVELQKGVKVAPAVFDKDRQIVQVTDEVPGPLLRGSEPLRQRPVVVGAGPCGYFAALKLAEAGYRPILLERGQAVAQRAEDVETFWQSGQLNLDSNVQYGEGGAGTFSDGKLTTRTHDRRIGEVFTTFVEAGAPEEIKVKAKPHIGTDRLRTVVAQLRQRLESLGGSVFFGAKVESLLLEKEQTHAHKATQQERKVVGLSLANGNSLDGMAPGGELKTSIVILAMGHSARDTAKALYDQDVPFEEKPFAIGLRVEHPQALIDESQYGEWAGHPRLGVADYQLHTKLVTEERTVFSFCMCPGGQVVAAASEEGGVVTNGMSAYARDSAVANSALVVSVKPEDFPIPGPLGGVEFQRIWERKAYQAGGSNYKAPAQSVEGFLQDQKGDLSGLAVQPTYRPGVEAVNLRDCLPKEVGEALVAGLEDFGRKIKGFNGGDAVLTGVETRTSAPWRIPRDESLQSIGVQGLYPAGEGAGYAGGIVSAAVDGLRVAEAIIATYRLVQ
ncbi:NAD(P)/FAD-dependent oxidoreductase [Heliorestis convoluta]|uniref:FAD dependent oxidoreductase family protein n=1 Tax=Heliorestis convoluta TaxID=356322 RepID=A0A5Q2N248_9FIRM|nr:hypothetical protein [Heliorestis convoluta]QGG46420.1 Putative FAD dependent oxidoreductase family protein [Heliorestis convoluta]